MEKIPSYKNFTAMILHEAQNKLKRGYCSARAFVESENKTYTYTGSNYEVSESED
jgi:hypothetical protein